MKPKLKEDNFLENIYQAIAEDRHVDYLKEVLRKYEEYKNEFERNFSEANSKDDVYRFRAKYLYDKIVWRDIEILGDQTFNDLADRVIFSMDWLNDHMHGFDLALKHTSKDLLFTGSSVTFFAPGWEDDPHPTYKSDEIYIADMDYEKQSKLRMTFDFGDELVAALA